VLGLATVRSAPSLPAAAVGSGDSRLIPSSQILGPPASALTSRQSAANSARDPAGEAA
jgi:hypothetical protein